MRGQESNLRRRVQSSACCHCTTPLCNTPRHRSRLDPAPQRAIIVLRLQIKKQLLYITHATFKRAQKPLELIIAFPLKIQFRNALLDKLFQILEPAFLLRQQHVAVVDQAFKLLGKIITNLLIYNSYQLVRETDRAYIALLHWVCLLCSFV